MKVGIRLPGGCPDGAYVYDYSQAVESLGFSSIWTIDHLLVAKDAYQASWPSGLETLAVAAAATRRVEIGTAVLVVPLYNPVLLAKSIGTLATLATDRFVLGIGPGWYEPEFQATGVPRSERGARTDESIALVQALLTQDSVTFDGRFYSVRDAAIEPRPKSPVPVWSAGGGSHTPGGGRDGGIAARVMNRILRHEGWLSGSSGRFLADTADDWAQITAQAEQRGQQPPIFGHTQFTHVALGDRDEVLTEQLTALSMVASPRKQRKDLEASFLVGTPDELDKRLTEYASIGVQHLVLTPAVWQLDQLKLIAQVFLGR